MLGQFPGRHRTLAQKLQDAPASRVGQGFKDIAHAI
jgi:hypothetical protein